MEVWRVGRFAFHVTLEWRVGFSIAIAIHSLDSYYKPGKWASAPGTPKKAKKTV